MAQILDGKALASSIENELSARVATLKEKLVASQFLRPFWWVVTLHLPLMCA